MEFWIELKLFIKDFILGIWLVIRRLVDNLFRRRWFRALLIFVGGFGLFAAIAFALYLFGGLVNNGAV